MSVSWPGRLQTPQLTPQLERLLRGNALTVSRSEEKELPIQSLIFGFGHKARHGKDTVAKMIKDGRGRREPAGHMAQQGTGEHIVGVGVGIDPGFDIRIYSLAMELKDEVNKNALASGGMRNLFTPDMEYMQTNGNFISLPPWVQYEENPDMSDPLCPLGKQRTLLQWWGTEFRRSVDPDYWVKKLAKRIALDKPEIAFITDIRFPNEVVFVRQYGEVIKVKRSGVAAVNPHPSETALDYMKDSDWDAVIYNDGTLEDLEKQALFVFDELMERTQHGD